MINDEIFDIALTYISSTYNSGFIEKFHSAGTSEKLLKKLFKKNASPKLIDNEIIEQTASYDSLLRKSESVCDYIQKSGIKHIRFDNPLYPATLYELPDKPFGIFVRGSIDYNYEKSVSIIGTRSPDDVGINRAKLVSVYYSSMECTVVSGLAVGLDSISHRTAIETVQQSGMKINPTIGILGSGIDRIYPAASKDLAVSIIDSGGGIISEYPPGAVTKRWYFPKRNRLIVGLTPLTVIVQTREKSGCMISAALAADYNRELYVYTPNSDADNGNKKLLETGAKEIKDHIQ